MWVVFDPNRSSWRLRPRPMMFSSVRIFSAPGMGARWQAGFYPTWCAPGLVQRIATRKPISFASKDRSSTASDTGSLHFAVADGSKRARIIDSLFSSLHLISTPIAPPRIDDLTSAAQPSDR